MKDAVIVSTARTPIGKAYRGAFNNTEAPTLGAHAIREAVARAGVEPEEVDDVIMGCAMQQGSSGKNVARQSLLAAGLPVTVAGMSVDRQCSSGMMAIAIAAKQVLDDNMPVVVGGGLESISLVQNEHYNTFRASDPNALAAAPDIYMSMLDTAETVTNEHLLARGTVRTIDDPVHGSVQIPGHPIKWKDHPNNIPLVAAALGQHNEAILTEKLGRSTDELEALRRDGILMEKPS